MGNIKAILRKIRKYLLNNGWILNAGNDPDVTTAYTAGCNINIEYPFQPLCPES
jgi:hypothetical protein